jgi:glycosyltransferase involved in cell wall biosynthesis
VPILIPCHKARLKTTLPVTELSILVDGSPFSNSHQKGIARYVTEVVRNTASDCSLLLDAPAEAPLPQRAHAIYRPERFPTAKHDLARRAWRKLGRVAFPTTFNRRALWHSSYFAPAPDAAMPSVVTVHDLIAEVFPHYHGDAEREVAMRRAAVTSAAAIIAVSQATASDICRLYPALAARVEVVHHGADHLVQTAADASPPFTASSPFALFVGNRGGYKNWLGLLDAVASQHWPRGVRMEMVGPPFTAAERTAISYRGVGDRVGHLGMLNDAGLSAAYRQAAAFVFPSLQEGFGFPLLEAQAHGTPVAASDIPVFHEIGGNAFVPFRPIDPDAVAAAIATALEPQRSSDLRAAGYENVRRFTWAECGRKTEAIWHRVMKETGLA